MALIHHTTDKPLKVVIVEPEEAPLDEATVLANRIAAEHKEFVKQVSRAEPTKKESERMMRRMYKNKQAPPPEETVGPARALRMRILSASLFPTLYNKKMVMENYGSE